LMMPNVNGYQVIAAVRELPRKPAVIVVTAQIPKQTVGVEADVVHAIIQKPFDLNALGSLMIDIARAMYAERTKVPARVDIRAT
jgi:CheY-like chemotaxis protein